MTKQKGFRIIAIVFAVLLAYVSYDIGRRTTFPGSKPQLKERIQKNFFDSDSAEQQMQYDDSLQERRSEDSLLHSKKDEE